MSEDQAHDMFLAHFLPVQTSLRGYLLAVTRDPTATDDLFQEVAAVLWRKFPDFDPARNFAAWAMGIAKMQVLRHRRSLARSRLVLSEAAVANLATAASAEAQASDARRVHLSSCIGKLPPNHRTIVDLRFAENRPLAEIAARIGKNLAAVEMAMVRIRRWLRDCVDKSMATEGARA